MPFYIYRVNITNFVLYQRYNIKKRMAYVEKNMKFFSILSRKKCEKIKKIFLIRPKGGFHMYNKLKSPFIIEHLGQDDSSAQPTQPDQSGQLTQPEQQCQSDQMGNCYGMNFQQYVVKDTCLEQEIIRNEEVPRQDDSFAQSEQQSHSSQTSSGFGQMNSPVQGSEVSYGAQENSKNEQKFRQDMAQADQYATA